MAIKPVDERQAADDYQRPAENAPGQVEQQQQGHAAQPQVAGGEIVKPLLQRLADLEVTPANPDAEEQQQNVAGPTDSGGQLADYQYNGQGNTHSSRKTVVKGKQTTHGLYS